MNLFVTLLWAAGAVIWARLGNPWLSALFAMNAGLWLSSFIAEVAND